MLGPFTKKSKAHAETTQIYTHVMQKPGMGGPMVLKCVKAAAAELKRGR